MSNAIKKTFIIVHAAWQAPYAWANVKELLLQQGFDVELIQLPGHGDDYTDPRSLHMDSYIQYVSNEVKKLEKQVILVGHSLAGVIISGVGEEIPQLIERLVYIAAYIPQSGQSAYAISMLDKQSLLGASLLVSDDQSEFDVKKDDIINIFCQDAAEDIRKLVLQNYRSEPGTPFSDLIVLTADNFGSIPKSYIETLQDNGIGNDLQKTMINAAAITDLYTINAGHSPSLTRSAEVTDALVSIANK